jgi:glutathione S-transferase
MIKLHHLNASRSIRILWLLEELELPYEVVLYQRDKKTYLAPESLKKIHPLGKSPVISDGEEVYAESGAIIEYLTQKYGKGKLSPSIDSPRAFRYHYWLHYAEGSLMPPLLLTLIFNRIESTPMPFFAKPIAKKIVASVRDAFINPQLKLHLDYLESELGKGKWICGDELTAADIQLSFPIEAAKSRGFIDSSRPNLMRFIENMHARPAYQRALANESQSSASDW